MLSLRSKKNLWVKDLFINHPVAIYYLTTFLISWGGLVIVLGGADRITSHEANVPFLPLYLVTVAGPFLSGILMTGLYDGSRGYRELISRFCKWRVGMKWYAFALLIAPITLFITVFILSLFSPVFLPAIFGSGDNPVGEAFGLPGNKKITLVLFVLGIGLFNGFVEEIGWTGFATHKFKRSLVENGFILGMIWGLWHLLSNYIGSADDAGAMSLPLYMAVILFSFLPPFRMIMTWIYDHTKSLFIAILMHASIDVFWILSMPKILTGEQRTIWYLAWAIVLWGIVLVIKITGNRRSMNQPS